MTEPSLKIRAITAFVGLGPDSSQWPAAVGTAAEFLRAAAAEYTAKGVVVQTTRIATNPFTEYVAAGKEFDDIQALEALCIAKEVSFLAICGSSDVNSLATAVAVASKLKNTCVAFQLPQLVGQAGARGGPSDAPDVSVPSDARSRCEACARAVLDIADNTNGGGNFRFCATANVEPGGPFFPAARAFSPATLHPSPRGAESPSAEQSSSLWRAADHPERYSKLGLQCFGIGTENDGLLANLGDGSGAWNVTQLVYDALLAPMTQLSQIATSLEASKGVLFLGIDTSINPALDTPSLTGSFDQMSGGAFGGPGTLATCASITQALKALPVPRTGYCGLMLPVCEDSGLAAATAEGKLDVQLLLACSSVCGVGLDTVPVPGRSGDAAADAALTTEIAHLMMDVSCIAYRLNKPLSFRLLPLPGKRAGDATTFDSPYLLQARVLPLTSRHVGPPNDTRVRRIGRFVALAALSAGLEEVFRLVVRKL